MVNVVVFKGPDVFASLEVVFSQSDVRFSSVIVVAFNGCLVDD